MPTMSKTPISASSEAEVVAGMPWSWAAGMKWVPIRPLVDQPQIQKVRNSAQKVHGRLDLAQRAQRDPGRPRAVAAGRRLDVRRGAP